MKLGAALTIAISTTAHADPLVLRADAFATTAAPAGLLTLSATGDPEPGLSAEAVVWMGSTGIPGNDAVGDVLVIALRARTDNGMASGTVGRFVAMLGALRPVHVDGAAGRLRLPHRIDLEAYAGIPVLGNLATSRAWDWVAGGRVSRKLDDWGSVGVAYLEQREGGEITTEEVGVDAGAALGKHDDLAAKLAYDLANPAVAEATLSASHRSGAVRAELYASYRAASHILPATSLFSVLGDIPAELVGTTWTWRAAPRLDLVGDLAVRRSDGDAIDGPTPAATVGVAAETIAPEAFLRATLRLDPRGASSLGCELRRDGSGDAGWTGARGLARIALPDAFAVSTELELVVPDRDRGLGAVWPWGLVALSWSRGPWDAAIATEASASPQDRRRIDALAQLGRRWGSR